MLHIVTHQAEGNLNAAWSLPGRVRSEPAYSLLARLAQATVRRGPRSRYGEAYDLAVTRAGWIAKRLDNDRALVADSPEKLRQKIEADVWASPIPGKESAGSSF
jgi:hypothetical protein